MGVSIHLFLFFLYILNFKSRCSIVPRKTFLINFSLYFAVALAVVQLLNPEVVTIIRNSISNVSINLVDYSDQPLSQFRAYGIFSNPNYFALFLILCFTISMHVSKKFNLILSIFVLFGVLLSGSRAGIISYSLLVVWWSIKSSNARYLLLSLIIVTCSMLQLYDGGDVLRVFNVIDLLGGNNPSSSGRINSIIYYIKDLVESNNLIKLFFGAGIFDNEGLFFDGDPGNFLYTYGIIGSLAFFLLIIDKFQKINALYLLLIILPFVFGGGIFGNLKLLLLFIFLPSVLSSVFGIKQEEVLTTKNLKDSTGGFKDEVQLR
jgi:hypothetical protein